MPRNGTLSLAVLIGASLLAGCATVPQDAGFQHVTATIADRAGQEIRWNRNTESDREVLHRIDTILAQELSADAAVQIALLGSPDLQATFEDLGIAQADLVEAGLLSNPVFDAALRFPDGGGRTNLELGLAANFVELLSIPLRKSVMAAEFQAAQLRVADEVLQFAAQTRQAYYTAVAANQRLELYQAILKAADASVDLAQRLRNAGNIPDRELALQQAELEQAHLDLNEAQTQAAYAVEHLVVLMGLNPAQVFLKLPHRLPDVKPSHFDAADLEKLALDQRLDLAASSQSIESARQRLGLSRTFSLIGETDIGVSAERETDGAWVAGPSISVPLPIFNQGQADVARSLAQFRQARQRHAARLLRVRSDVRMTLARMNSAHDRAARYVNSILPLRRRITEQTLREYNAMAAGAFQLIEIRRAEISAGREYVSALEEYWTSRAELERAIGGRLPMSSSESGPTTAPATSPVPLSEEQHQHH